MILKLADELLKRLSYFVNLQESRYLSSKSNFPGIN